MGIISVGEMGLGEIGIPQCNIVLVGDKYFI